MERIIVKAELFDNNCGILCSTLGESYIGYDPAQVIPLRRIFDLNCSLIQCSR